MTEIPGKGSHDGSPKREMSRELLDGKAQIFFVDSGDEINLGEDLKDVSESLEFALAQFYRQFGDVFKRNKKTERAMAANCSRATKKFGEQLGTPDEDNEHFFTEFPDAQYFDIRSQGPFKENYGDYHSVGMVVIPGSEENHFIVLDLTHNAVNSTKTRSTIIHTTNETDAYTALQSYYGGTRGWEANYALVPEKIGKEAVQPYVFLDDDEKNITESIANR